MSMDMGWVIPTFIIFYGLLTFGFFVWIGLTVMRVWKEKR